ncbi:hypothetical protein [Streptomyces sp. NPDC058695]|uniref:hypothetical protein n=1 Tax=Streptomyces sp. NPDC058695 TaxID=3346604 RepID=UPI003655BF5F
MELVAVAVAVAAVVVVIAATQERPAHLTRPGYAYAPETGALLVVARTGLGLSCRPPGARAASTIEAIFAASRCSQSGRTAA